MRKYLEYVLVMIIGAAIMAALIFIPYGWVRLVIGSFLIYGAVTALIDRLHKK